MKIPYNWLKTFLDFDLSPKETARVLTMVGHALDKPIFEQGGDQVMDLEDRGNRADVTGIVGIARDLAALLDTELIEPEISVVPTIDNSKFEVRIDVESDRVTRWRAVFYKDIRVRESPKWLRDRLVAYGIEPKNNVVDITNYVMLEYGMPTHAFDADKIDKIILRQAKKGEQLKTFDGGVLEFDENDLLAADSKGPLTLTTAVGGEESGISEETRTVLIEAGLYDQPTARRSALRLNVRNETSQRLGKYLHPELCELAIARIVKLMDELLGAKPEPYSFDYYPKPYQKTEVTLTQERLDLIAGEHVQLKLAKNFLERLGFLVVGVDDKRLVIEVPYFRTDVTMEDDVIEEVLRMRGYEEITSNMISGPTPKKLEFKELELEEKIKDTAVRLGFYEVVGHQIVDSKELALIGACNSEGRVSNPLDPKANIVKIENSWNEELNTMRTSIFQSIYSYLTAYTKHQATEIKLLETGKVFFCDSEKKGYEKYIEERRAGLAINGDFYMLKGVVEVLLAELGYEKVWFEENTHYLFKKNRSASIRAKNETEAGPIGVIGEVKDKTLSTLGIQTKLTFCELSISKLINIKPANTKIKIKTNVTNLTSEDFTITMPRNSGVGKLINEIENKFGEDVKVRFLDLYLANDSEKRITLNLKFNQKDQDTIRSFVKDLN